MNDQYLPAGGSNEAEIATPTKELVWSSSKLTATPRPEKNATCSNIEAKKPSKTGVRYDHCEVRKRD